MPNTPVPAIAATLPAQPAGALDRRAMLSVLVMIQNSIGNHRRDIMTFAGMCNDHELADHVMSEWRRIKSVERRAEILSHARALASCSAGSARDFEDYDQP